MKLLDPHNHMDSGNVICRNLSKLSTEVTFSKTDQFTGHMHLFIDIFIGQERRSFRRKKNNSLQNYTIYENYFTGNRKLLITEISGLIFSTEKY